MDRKSAFYLKVLFNRQHRGPIEEATKILPPPVQQALAKEKTTEKEISHAFRHPHVLLNKIHYSWIADTLSQLPEDKRLFYLAALPTPLQGRAAKLIGIDKEISSLKGPLKLFMQRDLILKILPANHIPLAYLPPSPLDPLLNISKSELIDLIHYLGIFDLAEEMKKTVNTKLLKNIRLALNAKEQEFLRSCIQGKDKIQTPRFPLSDWDGDAKELTQRLHKRGLIRLGMALSNQYPAFLWHITHMLDIGRGKKLMSHVSKETNPLITSALIEQVLQLIKFLHKGSQV